MVVKMENKNKTFKAWITYQALYAHFTREYDYFKYNGKLNMSEYSMETQFAKYEGGCQYSAQRQIFSNLGNTFEHKEDLIFFFLSQFTNDITYPSEFDSDLYNEYKERMNNFHFHLKRDIEVISKYMEEDCKTFDELFVAEKVNHPMVSDGVYDHETLKEINDENFNNLLDINHGEFLAKGGLEAGVLVLAANIMPFVYARHKKQISNEQFAQVLKKFIPNITAKTIHRITLLSIIGPLYAFFLISKFVGKVFLDGIDDDNIEEAEKKKDKSEKMNRREFFLFFKPKII